jgi:hypothetical protein
MIQACAVAGAAQVMDNLPVSQLSCNRRKRIELLSRGSRREQQQKQYIDRLTVNRIEVDGLSQASQDTEGRLQASNTACGIATPPPTPVEPKSSRLRIARDGVGIQLEARGGSLAKLRQQARLVRRANVHHRVARCEKVLDVHWHPNWRSQPEPSCRCP